MSPWLFNLYMNVCVTTENMHDLNVFAESEEQPEKLVKRSVKK